MSKVSFKAKQGVYLTYKNYTYKAPQVFGEFIDNSIQSYESNKNLLLTSESNFKLRVDIIIDWALDFDKVVKAKQIIIKDNAAGMTATQFASAFDLADQDVIRTGMNEFGIGMKAAASWLGNNWRVETTSIDDNITRILDVDLTTVVNDNIDELESNDILDPSKTHGTTIVISNLWNENPILKTDEDELIKSIASIYRYFIRTGELQIYVGDTLLEFEDYDVLTAPSYLDPDGEDIKWKCLVNTDDKKGHGISGFVALLKDTADEKRGVVIMRNHRVVMGFDPKDRTVGKIFYGQIGSKKYRRVYGELEITGFKVAFGKNQVNDPNLLEALCKMAAAKLKINGTNLLTQGDKYTKRSKKPTPPVTPKPPVTPPVTPKPPVTPPVTPKPPVTPPVTPKPLVPKNPNLLSTGKFKFGGIDYEIIVEKGTESQELFWNDLSEESQKKLKCKVNVNHAFFNAYGQPSKQMIAMIKALSIAKFKAIKDNGGSASAMMNEFNQIINNQSVLN